MPKILLSIQSFCRARAAATAIEYTLIAAGVAMAISAVVFAFGEDLAGLISSLSTVIDGK